MYFWALLEVACFLYRLFHSKKSPQSPRKSYSKYFYLVNCYKVNLFQVSFQPNNPGSFWFCFRVVLIDSKNIIRECAGCDFGFSSGFAFALLFLVIGPEKSRHFFQQSDEKLTNRDLVAER